MDNHDRLILHQGHTWCQTCVLNYIEKLEDFVWCHDGVVLDIVQEVRDEVASPKRR
jgi:hypothetical protein